MTVHKRKCWCGKTFYTMVLEAEECAECLTTRVRDDTSTASLVEGMSSFGSEVEDDSEK